MYKYIHIGDHIQVKRDGHIRLFGVGIDDTEESAVEQLDKIGLKYEYDKPHHYIQFDGCYDETFVLFDNAVRHCSLDIGFHFSEQGICEQIGFGHRESSVFSCTGLRCLADSIELFSDCLRFSHYYGQISKAGIIKVYKAGREYVLIELNNGFHITIYSEKDYKRRMAMETIFPTSIIDNKK